MSELKILYHGEARLADWGESRTGGKWVKLFLPDLDETDPLDSFRGMDTPSMKRSGHVLQLTIAEGDIIAATKTPEPKHWGYLSRKLYSLGFFHAQEVLEVLGTDDEFLAWIRTQPSAHSKEFSEFINGQGRCEAAHVRRSNNAGTGIKPEYSAIPLTHDEHALQHQQGESAIRDREWFDSQASKYRVLWAKTKLCELFNVESTRYIDPVNLVLWAIEKGIYHLLPKDYRNYEE